MNAKQLAALSVWQRQHNMRHAPLPPPTPELAALAELLALIDVLVEIAVIDLPPKSWRALPFAERAGDVAAGEGGVQAIDAFFEAIESGNALVASHFRARAGA
jgi:hypothetical protein